MNDKSPDNDISGIAIIGIAVRFPGAKNIDDLWRNLCQGKESITFFNDNELDPGIDPSIKSNANYVKARGIFEGIDEFDPKFFGMTPREAEVMDPQQRIFMEIAWEAFENAGYNPESYKGLVGVFAGTGLNTYYPNNVLTNRDVLESIGRHQAELGNAPDYLATRVSFKFNLTGPSISLYTGCSTSLVAVCQAYDNLMSFQSDMALAGGVFVACPPNSGYLYQEGEMFSVDGHTRPFDASATGTVFSCGAGVVVLKRLEDAINDGDFVYSVIRGTAVNNDGSDKISFTAPSVKGQAAMIAMALANAGVHPERISYIETHGTGTALGDPIEIEALSQAFRMETQKKQFCAIGSLKGNIGHLDAAAGVAGLIKTALSLHHKTIPPSINFEKPNPKIDFENSPFYINTGYVNWETDPEKRIAGVSSLGVGGTNAHIILEEAPDSKKSSPSNRWQLLKISARTKTALDEITTKLANHLEKHDNLDLGDVAFTLQEGRKDFSYRRIAVCEDIPDAIKTLRKTDSNRIASSYYEPINKDIVFMFSGQGAQYPNMGLDLYKSEPVFREHIDRCSKLLEPHLNFDLRDVLFPAGDNIEQAADKLKQTYITQPALFTIEYALAILWMSWKITPNTMIGHSIGEYVAACLAGVFSLEDALFLVATRGRLIQDLPSGAMLAVFLSEKEVQEFLNDKISLSVINGPSLCVLAGAENDIKNLGNALLAKDVQCTRLHTSHAFHAQMMEPILAPFEDVLKNIKMESPKIPFISNVSGKKIEPAEATSSGYWVRHLRNTVRFSGCLEELFKAPNRIFLEVGPGNTLAALAKQHPARQESHRVISSIRHPNESISDRAFILRSAGKLWLDGKKVDWPKLYPGESGRRIPLPTYPFEKERYWIDSVRDKSSSGIGITSTKEGAGIAVSTDELTRESQPECAQDVSLNNAEKTILVIWKKLLGYRQIDINDNYFELGGNSLMAVRMFTQIEKIFGKRLPLATLYEAPTIRKLAAIISEEKYVASWASLVKIQPSGSRPPFFCIHAEGGNVLEYRLLAAYLGNDQPFYGLQAKGLEGKTVIDITIGEMAKDYIREIKTVQPGGPYYIGGYCLGGIVAFEMAQQLQHDGEEVAFLALISTSTPDQLRNIKPHLTAIHKKIYNILERVELEIDNMSILSTREMFLHIIDRTIRTKNLFRYRFEDFLDKLFSKLHLKYKWHTSGYTIEKSVDLSDDAYMAYQPKPLKNRVHLIRVSRQKRELLFDPALGWQGLAENGLDIYEVPGFHKNVLKEPHVQTLAIRLGDLLKSAQTKNK
jgi:acyl transferase domain-containing protein/thioesterase domain-containing protein